MTDQAIERRRIDAADLEVRELEDGSITFRGYAAVFDSPSEPLPFVETISRGAFARSLANRGNDIPLLVNHNPGLLPLATTGAGSLKLTEDTRGLLAEATLPATSLARDLRTLADTGHVRHMSFAFKPTKGGESWSEDGKRRSISEARLYEVSVLAGQMPAYRTTTAYLRSVAQELERDADDVTDAVEALRDGRALTDAEAALLRSLVDRLSPEPEPEPEPVPAADNRRYRLVLAAHSL